jgi:hypothetical protein
MTKPPVVTVTLLASELTAVIDCVRHLADRADSWANTLADNSEAEKIARERAERLYALAGRLDDTR